MSQIYLKKKWNIKSYSCDVAEYLYKTSSEESLRSCGCCMLIKRYDFNRFKKRAAELVAAKLSLF